MNDLTWLIAASCAVKVEPVQRGGYTQIQVILDLDEAPYFYGEDTASALAKARAYCESVGITP